MIIYYKYFSFSRSPKTAWKVEKAVIGTNGRNKKEPELRLVIEEFKGARDLDNELFGGLLNAAGDTE